MSASAINSGSTTEWNGPTLKEESQPSTRGSGSVYRMIWRWHFYAGLLVSPILIVVALTGAAYVFRSEIEDAAHARHRFVKPGNSKLQAEALIALAQAVHSGKTATSLELSSEPTRTAVVRFEDADHKRSVAYVDPYRGLVLNSNGSSDEDGLATFFDVILQIHRQLFMGTVGRVIVELSVGWTIVLLVTGLYLWLPKKVNQTKGVWWIRLRAKPYTILRDLHSVLGFYLLVPSLMIVVTGLFYTLVWSEAFYRLTRDGKPAATKPGDRTTKPIIAGHPLPLNRLVEIARAQYPAWNLSVSLQRGDKPEIEIRAGNDFNNAYGPYQSALLRLDSYDGKILSVKTLAQDERYWWHGWAYPLHVGSVLGPTSKVLWFITCLILCALPITGLWMWLKRRPKGKTGIPRRSDLAVPPALSAFILILAITLPIVGVSIVLIVVGEWIVDRIREVMNRRPVG